MTARAIERMEVERDLRRALANGEFELHYQPIVSLADDRIVAVEALARWRHPQRGLVPPSEFIPIAEEVGLIDALGEWVLRTACAEAAGWPSDARVAVNVSACQFAGRGLVATVIDAVRSAGLRPERLELEVTESVFLDNSEANLAVHARADRLRRQARARRFRRRLLVARLPADLLLQPHQDRPRLRRRSAGAAANPRRSCGRSRSSPRACTSTSPPRASRRRGRCAKCSCSAAPRCKASCSPGRARPPNCAACCGRRRTRRRRRSAPPAEASPLAPLSQ